AAKDQFGNTASAYTGTVTFSSDDPQAVLPANYTFTTGAAADNGVHVFTGVALKSAGTFQIVATDTITASVTGSETGIAVSPATP
ncbi:hypothetical protein AAEH76_22035, partial [Shewanella algae]|uniref:hypothetical protein n=1 Tax=Shewanella algae TaxID=38313 RepID=UPI00313B9C85